MMDHQNIIEALGPLTVIDIAVIAELTDIEDDRVFVERFFRHKSKEVKLSGVYWGRWSDKKLLSFASDWLHQNTDTKTHDTNVAFAHVRHILKNIKDQFDHDMQELAAKIHAEEKKRAIVFANIVNQINLHSSRVQHELALQFSELSGKLNVAFADIAQQLSAVSGFIQLSPEKERLIDELPEHLRSLPVTAIFATDMQLRRLSAIRWESFEDEKSLENYRRLTEKAEADLRSLLVEEGMDFDIMIAGANHAIENQHPDWLRHASASLRELYKQVVKQYVDDDVLKTWAVSSRLQTSLARRKFQKKKGTYVKQIDYLLQHFIDAPFIEQITTAIINLIDSMDQLNDSVHKPVSANQQNQMVLIRLIVFDTLVLLIKVFRLNPYLSSDKVH